MSGIGTGTDKREGNGYEIALESDLLEASNGKSMVFGTLMDVEVGQPIAFVAFGGTAEALADGKLRPKHPNLAEEQDGQSRRVLTVSVWQDANGKNVLA